MARLPITMLLKRSLILCLLLSAGARAGAELEWETLSAELTSPPAGQVRHSFRFKNTGRETIHIENAKSSCSCIMVELGERNIAPGESGELVAVSKPAPGSPPGSERGARIEVTTAEAPVKPHILRIKLRTDREAGLEPAVLWWQAGAPALAKETVVQVPFGTAVRLTDEALQHAEVECVLSEVKNGGTAILSVRPRSTRQPLELRLPLEFTSPGKTPERRTLFLRVQ